MDKIEALVNRVRIEQSLPPPDQRRAIREAAGLSMDDLGEALGVSRQAVSHWERGQRHPRAGVVVRYAKLLYLLSQ